MGYEPIAIVGFEGIFPSADNAEQLWQKCLAGEVLFSNVKENYWHVKNDSVIAPAAQADADQTWNGIGGFVNPELKLTIPDHIKQHSGFAHYQQLDPGFKWLLQVASSALLQAGVETNPQQKVRGGIIIGSLSYPSEYSNCYTINQYLKQKGIKPSALFQQTAALNRFAPSFALNQLAELIGFEGNHFALDAACASSLHAVAFACRQLQTRQADIMLAGGLQCTDNIFLHVGFARLKALSQTGLSKSLRADADGLVPAEGCGLVALMRLSDALAQGKKIYGIVRSVGLSNDGAGKGMLVPSQEGQIRAILQAYQLTDVKPSDVEWIDCHATGTPVGDNMEVNAISQVFTEAKALHIGALKTYVGHMLTASGIAALIRVLKAFEHGLKPPTHGVMDNPLPDISRSHFSCLEQAQAWPQTAEKPMTAAINGFGFGGNNAHLVLQNCQMSQSKQLAKKPIEKEERQPIAIIAQEVRLGSCDKLEDFSAFCRDVFQDKKGHDYQPAFDTIDLPLRGVKFTPNDLKDSLPEQLAILSCLLSNAQYYNNLSSNTAVFVGLSAAIDTARFIMRWRIRHNSDIPADELNLDNIAKPLNQASVIGNMPNIFTNRLNRQFDFQADSCSLYAQELSGLQALSIACDELRHGVCDTAIVAAVELAANKVHQAAVKEVYQQDKTSDAVVVFTLKRLSDANSDNDNIIAIINDIGEQAEDNKAFNDFRTNVRKVTGDMHAVNALMDIALGIEYGHLVKDGALTIPLCYQGRQLSVILNQDNQITTIADNSQQKVEHSAFIVKLFQADDKATLLQKFIDDDCLMTNHFDQPHRLAIFAKNEEKYDKQKDKLLKQLRSNSQQYFATDDLVYSSVTKPGDLAFVFTSLATSYQGMGKNLLRKVDDITENIKQRYDNIDSIIESIENDNPMKLDLILEMRNYSLLCQVHSQIIRNYFNVQPQSVMGYCAGEMNAIMAMDLWHDYKDIYSEMDAYGMFGRRLSGEYNVIDECWPDLKDAEEKWATYRILVPFNDLEAEIEKYDRLCVTIINTDQDFVMAGDPRQCEELVKKCDLRYYAVKYPLSLIIHNKYLNPFAEDWGKICSRELHQPAYPFKLYSAGMCDSYLPEKEKIKQALMMMATDRFDWRQLIDKAYADGNRFFIEIGPRNLCSQWIGQNLTGKEHIALSMDVCGTQASVQNFKMAVTLWLMGYIEDFPTVLQTLSAKDLL